MPACNVPIGQIYLQKAGVLTPLTIKKYSGRYITNINKIAYLPKDSQRVALLFRNFSDGILFSKSCTNPNGHKNAQIARPNNTPNKIKTPTIYKGSLNLTSPSAVWKLPRGQAAMAPGQEWQFSPGTHKPFVAPVYIVPRANPTMLILYKSADNI